jgi:ATP-dependent DNA ligase
VDLPVDLPVAPMLSKAVEGVPEGEDLFYEPKWDGFRCIVSRDGDEVELGSRNDRPLTRYFPELPPALRATLPPRCVVDGEVVIATDDGLDFDALQQRIHPAESRIRMLASKTPASFVAFDLLAVDDRSLMEVPFAERRTELERVLADARPPVYLTPITRSAETARDWFTRFEGAGLDGVVAKPGSLTYRPNERVMLKVKHRRTADAVVAGFRVHKSGDGLGSLLVGLFDSDGVLHHVGVASGFSAALRRQLAVDVEPLRADALDDHPWRDWADAMAHAAGGGRMPGGPSRWNAKKDLSWEPLRPERVCEVAFEQVQSGRFRHASRFVRWRPDKEPHECTYDQLDTPVPAELAEVFKGVR